VCEPPLCASLDCDPDNVTIGCCIDENCEAGEVCVNEVCILRGNPRFTLTWFGDDDLDLHVITPGGVEIFWNNRIDEISGGFLDFDDLGGIPSLRVENTVFQVPETTPNGNYTYFVVNFQQRGEADSWTLEVFEDGVGEEGLPIQTRFGEGSSTDFTYVR